MLSSNNDDSSLFVHTEERHFLKNMKHQGNNSQLLVNKVTDTKFDNNSSSSCLLNAIKAMGAERGSKTYSSQF